MKTIVRASLTGILIATATPIMAADKTPEEMMEEGSRLILNAIELMIKSIPQYHAPEVLENGDIIIRRVQPDEQKNNDGDTPPKETRT